MKTFGLIPLALFIIAVHPFNAQEKQLIREADLATSRMEYEEAIILYDAVLVSDSNSYRANAGKGMLLSRYLDRYKRAIPYLERALNQSPSDTLIDLFNILGRCYLYVENYPRSLYYFSRVKAKDPNFDPLLNVRIANCNYAIEHTTITPESEAWVKNIGLPINSNMPDYGAVPLGNDLIFTSERKDSKYEKRNGVSYKYFETMYKTTFADGKYSEPVRFSFPDNMDESKYIKHNEAIISASADGNRLYIFRDGRIYETDMNDPTQEVSKLDKNVNIAHYQNHASITADGNELYFVSNEKKGYGGTDIYVTKKDKDNNWSTPEILDMTVNSVYDEDAPYMSGDGTLYYSSNGLPGYGGFDVYKTHKVNGAWTTPENLGRPINGSGDDLYFLLGENSTEGYYSSARPSGHGDVDIYKVHYAPIRLKETIIPLTPIAILNPIKTTEPKPILRVVEQKKPDWIPSTVYFDFDKSTLKEEGLAILDRNVTELIADKNLNFSISGYTDSRGSDAYNLNLSSMRVNYVRNYLIVKGISKNRIIGTYSLGETKPVNNCIDGVECNEDEYQMNRRVDFKIINIQIINKQYLGLSEK